MIETRLLGSLGAVDLGWLRAKHHFSFAGYRDPSRTTWGSLRVWNDDTIAPQHGFPTHEHEEMEIITYVREGAITHADDLGNRGRTPAGGVQVMSAGTGIRHSEFNLEAAPTKIFQIWVLPNSFGGPPSWSTRDFPKANGTGEFVILASGLEEDTDAMPLRADARLLAASLKTGQTVKYTLGSGRYAYLVAATGAVELNEVIVEAGDGAAIRDIIRLNITALADSEILMTDSA